MIETLSEILRKVNQLKVDSATILSLHETSTKRLITVEQTRNKLSALNLNQQKLIDEAIGCAEHGHFRSSHVSIWSAFIDFLEEKLASDNFVKLHTFYPSWIKIKTVDDLKEQIAEYQIVEAAKKTGLLTKAESKTLLGLLSKRNECAHPSGYHPSLNETLGFISELLNRIEIISGKNY